MPLPDQQLLKQRAAPVERVWVTSLLASDRAGQRIDELLASRALRALIWCRYLIMTALCMWLAFKANVAAERRLTDWLVFEDGARTIVHYHHIPIYDHPALHVYANNANIQVGPPALLTVAALEWAKPATVENFFIVVMCCCGVVSLVLAEASARILAPRYSRRRLAALMTFAGIPAMAAWGNWVGFWLHWDDVLALTATAVALWLVSRSGSWWLVGLLLGTAVSSKPWAIVMTPVLVGLPRADRGKATLALLGAAALWWGPFVLAAPSTIQALGGLQTIVRPGSVLFLFGVRGDVNHWIRPVQFAAGTGFALWIALRSNRAWLAAPLAGLVIRVFTDPYVYSYYGMGPVLFSLVWDMTRTTARRLPIYTLATLFVEFGVIWLAGQDHQPTGTRNITTIGPAVAKLVWCLGVAIALIVHTRRQHRAEELARAALAVLPDPELAGATHDAGTDIPVQDHEPAHAGVVTA